VASGVVADWLVEGPDRFDVPERFVVPDCFDVFDVDPGVPLPDVGVDP
jgi:hypothetical protein